MHSEVSYQFFSNVNLDKQSKNESGHEQFNTAKRNLNEKSNLAFISNNQIMKHI